MEKVKNIGILEKNPLVSIIVITYNSAKYVLETLESAKAQTYQKIELIIADDGSKDETVAICRKWLNANGARFVRIDLITVEENTGIPANCNRGLHASTGEWLKLIAGDDLLTSNCIMEFALFAIRNPRAECIASNMLVLEGGEIIKKIKIDPYLINRTAEGQLKMLCRFFFIIPGPSMYIKRNILIQLNGYDERFKLVEDFPFLFKAMKNGIKFYHLDEELIIYRQHDESISRGKEDKLKNTFGMFFNLDFYPYLKKENYLLYRNFTLSNNISKTDKKVVRIFFSLIIRLTDPYYWYFKFHEINYRRKKWSAVKEYRL
jgi:alpha-1,3-rhamnosyltransferase